MNFIPYLKQMVWPCCWCYHWNVLRNFFQNCLWISLIEIWMSSFLVINRHSQIVMNLTLFLNYFLIIDFRCLIIFLTLLVFTFTIFQLLTCHIIVIHFPFISLLATHGLCKLILNHTLMITYKLPVKQKHFWASPKVPFAFLPMKSLFLLHLQLHICNILVVPWLP